MVQLKAQRQQQAALEHAGWHALRVADGAEQDRVVRFQSVQVGVREQLAGSQVAAGAEIEIGRFHVVAHGVENFEALRHDFWSDAVAREHCNFHILKPSSHIVETSFRLSPRAALVGRFRLPNPRGQLLGSAKVAAQRHQ